MKADIDLMSPINACIETCANRPTKALLLIGPRETSPNEIEAWFKNKLAPRITGRQLQDFIMHADTLEQKRLASQLEAMQENQRLYGHSDWPLERVVRHHSHLVEVRDGTHRSPCPRLA